MPKRPKSENPLADVIGSARDPEVRKSTGFSDYAPAVSFFSQPRNPIASRCLK